MKATRSRVPARSSPPPGAESALRPGPRTVDEGARGTSRHLAAYRRDSPYLSGFAGRNQDANGNGKVRPPRPADRGPADGDGVRPLRLWRRRRRRHGRQAGDHPAEPGPPGPGPGGHGLGHRQVQRGREARPREQVRPLQPRADRRRLRATTPRPRATTASRSRWTRATRRRSTTSRSCATRPGPRTRPIDLYTRATKADPKFATAFLNLGLLLVRDGQDGRRPPRR